MFLESIGVGQTLAPYLPALSGHEQGIPLSEPQLLHLQNKAISASRGAGQMEMVKGFRRDRCRHLPRIWGDTRSCESGLWDWAGGDAVSVEPCFMEFWGRVLAGVG